MIAYKMRQNAEQYFTSLTREQFIKDLREVGFTVEDKIENKIELNIECSLCKSIINERKESWDIINGLEFCENCKEKLEAVEKIESSFMYIICDKIREYKNKGD